MKASLMMRFLLSLFDPEDPLVDAKGGCPTLSIVGGFLYH
jgi:hypothetical protein